MKYVLLLLVALAVLGLARIRLAGDDVAVWHVDPLTVTPGAKRNDFLMRSGDGDADSAAFAMEATELARIFDQYALSRPRVTRLSGMPDELWMTYIQRSRWFGFPDYISVRIVPAEGGGSGLTIYSRARYGDSDLGVNKARITTWVEALRRIEAELPAEAPE